jgi:hypothetical protein
VEGKEACCAFCKVMAEELVVLEYADIFVLEEDASLVKVHKDVHYSDIHFHIGNRSIHDDSNIHRYAENVMGVVVVDVDTHYDVREEHLEGHLVVEVHTEKDGMAYEAVAVGVDYRFGHNSSSIDDIHCFHNIRVPEEGTNVLIDVFGP